MHRVQTPAFLLWRDIRGARDTVCHLWVDEEEDKNLAMTRFRLVHKLKGRNLMLIYVRKR